MIKILVIEDSKSILEEISSILTMEGFKVHTAYNGWEGLEKANEVLPDIIISAIIMPGLDGFLFIKQLKKYPLIKDIPLIFLSAKADSFIMNRGINLGASAFLTKPLSPEKLLQAVRNIIKGKLSLRINKKL